MKMIKSKIDWGDVFIPIFHMLFPYVWLCGSAWLAANLAPLSMFGLATYLIMFLPFGIFFLYLYINDEIRIDKMIKKGAKRYIAENGRIFYMMPDDYIEQENFKRKYYEDLEND